MNLAELEKHWSDSSKDTGEVQRRIWNRVAEEFYQKPLPDFATDPFLRHVAEHFPLNQAMRCLDIGCGAGHYSMALAPLVEEAVGIDISPHMIQFAQKTAVKCRLKNVHFQCLNWTEADIDQLGLRGSFDLVFAHMTPAVSDFQTFDKMNACARRWCITEKPARRQDRILDKALRAAGFGEQDKEFDTGVLYAFTYLWNKGYTPRLDYRQEVWRIQRTESDMTSWCMDRARLRRNITSEEEQAIRETVSGFASDGMTEEIVTTTIVTMYWGVC